MSATLRRLDGTVGPFGWSACTVPRPPAALAPGRAMRCGSGRWFRQHVERRAARSCASAGAA
jgi:hypothetical protein